MVCVKVRNYSFLDVIWSYGVAILAPLYAFAGPGHIERKVAFTALGVAPIALGFAVVAVTAVVDMAVIQRRRHRAVSLRARVPVFVDLEQLGRDCIATVVPLAALGRDVNFQADRTAHGFSLECEVQSAEYPFMIARQWRSTIRS